MSKKFGSLMATYVVIFILFCALYFIVPFGRTNASITAFLFGLASIVMGCATAVTAFGGKGTVKSAVYGLPIMTVGIVYMIIQLIFSFVIFVLNTNNETPAWISAAVGVVLIAAAFVGLLFTDNARDIVEQYDKKFENDVKPMSVFKLDVGGLVSKCEDAETKKLLEKLAEKLRFSDPVSSPSLAGVEMRISQAVSEIDAMLGKGSYDGMADKIKALDILVDERNRQCKAEKGNMH